MQMVAIACETRIFFDGKHHVEIARRTSERAGFTFALITNACSVFHARGNLDLHGVFADDSTLAAARLTWIGNYFSGAAAASAGARDGEEALLIANLTAPSAIAARGWLLAVRSSASPTRVAGLGLADRNFGG